MSAIINSRRMVSAQPFVISSLDPAVEAYVAGITAPTIHSDTATEEWGLVLGADHGPDGADSGGTAYLLSAESYKRVVTGRFAS